MGGKLRRFYGPIAVLPFFVAQQTCAAPAKAA
jgi:hypothetical protein